MPPCPAYLSAPPLNLALRPRALPLSTDPTKPPPDPATDREQRDRSIKELYVRLQAVFPGFDPKKEPAYGRQTSVLKGGHAGMNQASPVAQRTPQMGNMPAPSASRTGSVS